LQSPTVSEKEKSQLSQMIAKKGDLSFYDIYTLTKPDTAKAA